MEREKWIKFAFFIWMNIDDFLKVSRGYKNIRKHSFTFTYPPLGPHLSSFASLR
jgi:hypothetical protein